MPRTKVKADNTKSSKEENFNVLKKQLLDITQKIVSIQTTLQELDEQRNNIVKNLVRELEVDSTENNTVEAKPKPKRTRRTKKEIEAEKKLKENGISN